MGMVKGSSRDIIGILEWEEIYNKAEAIFEKIISKSFPKLVKELKWIILTLEKNYECNFIFKKRGKWYDNFNSCLKKGLS